jgi:homoserine dehydrogenase
MGAATTAYLVHLRVVDQPGVLATVAGTFAEHGASIRSLTQKGEGDQAELLILTHLGREADLAATVAQLRECDAVTEVVGLMRVIGGAQ